MITARRKTGLIFFPAYDWEISPSHPERQERLLYTQDQVMEEGVLDIEGITEFKAGLATEKDICRPHFCVPDVESRITPSHSVSAGGCIEAARLVLDGTVDNAFALVRPPGHHAMRVVHGARGFCNINIEAVMIEWVRKHYPHIRKIAVVDTDCHHGDGTQDVYWHDPNVLYISLHQDGRTLYPGSGFPEEFGGPNALGKNLNIPLPPRTSDEGILHVMEHFVMPVLKDFEPDLIINSAGQDNHYSDPITNMSFTAGGYARLNEILAPDICVLEGGYSIEAALPYVNTGIILALAGVDYSYIREPDLDPERIREDPRVIDYIRNLTDDLLDLWSRREHFERPQEEFFRRSRNIFYDTDGISENQHEVVRVCTECPGAYRIDSSASTGYHVLAIHIPWGACSRCREQGLAWFEKPDRKNYYAVYLQDMDNDEYSVKIL
ncbi:MAG TPA: histone deacetylase [Deltaproteobacteria bacterium]|jgi:acetoin utilization deacetylase AcuC-like enzyme|nr:histone deacetylase [Deltaproteobacteria bacterium]HQA70898.1 histone deacetylase [Deltaproteobacteria bacterium]HQQ13956.1 histone deacetylase [Deltaproteobacteria bacterium]